MIDPFTTLLALDFDKGSLSDACIVLARGSDEPDCQVYGEGNLVNDTPVPAHSISKLFTTLLTFRLIELGELSVDLHVADVLPQFARMRVFDNDSISAPQVVNTRLDHLLNHSSGIDGSGFGHPSIEAFAVSAGLYDLDCYGGTRTVSRNEYLDIISTVPLAFVPGTDWSYGRSHDVLGCLLEVATGATLPVLFHELVGRHLDLKATAFTSSSVAVPMDAFRSAGSGLYTCADDILKACQYLHRDPRARQLIHDLSLQRPVGRQPDIFPGSLWGFGPGFAVTRIGDTTLCGWLSRQGSCYVTNLGTFDTAVFITNAPFPRNRTYFRRLTESFFNFHGFAPPPQG